MIMDRTSAAKRQNRFQCALVRTLYVREKLSLYSVRSLSFSQWRDWRIEDVRELGR